MAIAEEMRLNEEKKALSDEAGRVKQELEKLQTQRAELSGRVDKKMLAKYD